MSSFEYKQRHPLAWALIGGIALFSVAAIGAMQGWLPGTGSGDPAAAACADCATVEAVRAVEMPVAPPDPATEPVAGTEGALADAAEPAALVSYSYEITVRYEDGSLGVFSQADPPAWQAGDKVRVVDGMILVAG